MRSEILMLVDALAREKNVDRDRVHRARAGAGIGHQEGLAGHAEVVEDADIVVRVDHDTGEYTAARRWKIVADDENEPFEFPDYQYLLREAQELDPSKQVGDYIEEPMEVVDFGRIGAQAAKQVILQRVRDAEREQTAGRLPRARREAGHRHRQARSTAPA
jgi:N utilization substance protein A